MAKGSGTRSGLLWEVERLLNEVENLPQVLVMENVPQVHGEGNREHFYKWIEYLESKGYTNWWKDLSATDFGVAQTRTRTIMVSLLGNYRYRFPDSIPLEKTVYDYLEDNPNERCYFKGEKAQKMLDALIDNGTIPTEQNRTEQNRTEQNRTEQNRWVVDLTINNPRERSISNCIAARCNRGISNRSQEGCGVCERISW